MSFLEAESHPMSFFLAAASYSPPAPVFVSSCCFPFVWRVHKYPAHLPARTSQMRLLAVSGLLPCLPWTCVPTAFVTAYVQAFHHHQLHLQHARFFH
ncbi:hypothetical protein C8R45DRAFT_966693 [Mycena sanguinolenta]|nr:hypothetical protein C8R45DRAFT_966693 [Mycena sanguinolenta]